MISKFSQVLFLSTGKFNFCIKESEKLNMDN